MADSDLLRYLPLEVGGQVFGIRMADVIAVRRLDAPAHTKQVDAGAEATSEPEAQVDGNLPVIDLRHLLWREKTTGRNRPVIVISSGAKAAALLADSVMPIRTADVESSQPYPKLAHFENCFFDRVVRDQEGLVLLFDVPLLLDRLGAASPTLIAEGEYGG